MGSFGLCIRMGDVFDRRLLIGGRRNQRVVGSGEWLAKVFGLSPFCWVYGFKGLVVGAAGVAALYFA